MTNGYSSGKEDRSAIEKTGDDLFEFALDQEDIKWLMATLAEAADINRNTVAYELPILKIISIGWSISYYLESGPQKDQLQRIFWDAVNEFSKDISVATSSAIGKDIDYFQILKDRLKTYVDKLALQSDAKEPATVIGPEFADICGNRDDIFTSMTGAKMFASTIGRVKAYLEAIKLR